MARNPPFDLGPAFASGVEPADGERRNDGPMEPKSSEFMGFLKLVLRHGNESARVNHKACMQKFAELNHPLQTLFIYCRCFFETRKFSVIC